MASQKQIQANRRNAQKSTGPKTPQGKSTVAQNALKHGLRSNRVLIASDDPAEFDAHRGALLEDLAPVGPMETILADRIVKLTWQLSRATAFQSETIDTLIAPPKNDPPRESRKFSTDWVYWNDQFLEKIGISTEKFDQMMDEGVLDDYVDHWIQTHPEEFQQYSKDLGYDKEPDSQPENIDDTEPLPLGQIAVNDFAETRILERLVMYERRIESSLFKTQLQLERLQLRRKANEQKDRETEDIKK